MQILNQIFNNLLILNIFISVAVVVAFFLCWAPFHAQRLMAIYLKEATQVNILVFHIVTYISGVTYYVSATINPILYSIMSLKFRQAFKDTLGRCCGRQPSGPRFGKFGSVGSSRFNSTIRSTLGTDFTDVSVVSKLASEHRNGCKLINIENEYIQTDQNIAKIRNMTRTFSNDLAGAENNNSFNTMSSTDTERDNFPSHLSSVLLTMKNANGSTGWINYRPNLAFWLASIF